MKRIVVLVSTCAAVLAAGCLGEPEYNRRLEGTLELMRYEQKLNDNLNPAEQSGLKEKEVYLRAPIPLAHDPQIVLPVTPGSYDLAESFSGSPTTSGGSPSPLPIRLHVLARWKKPPKSPTKKGEVPPQPAQRGPFEQDVRALLASAYGNNEVVEKKAEPGKPSKGNPYKRLVFKSGTDNAVRAYFYDVGNHYVALILDVPPSLADAKAANQAADYMLETLAVGNAARTAFEGRAAPGAASGGAAF